MKTLRTFLMTMMLLAGNTDTASASDFKTIYKRMYDTYLKSNPSEKKVNELLDSMTPEGAFSDIDYTVTSGAPRKHVQNLIVLANAYQESKNKFYRDKTLKEAYLKSLRFWVDTDHHAANWWYRYIPYPKELSQGVILMADEIRKDPELFEKTMAYLRYSYETAKPAHMTGANAADIIMGSLTASILTEDDAQMIRFRDQMTSLLTIQETEGVLRDYLYGQHCGNGRQLYFTSYGKEFVNSMLFYLEFCQGTKYQSPGLSLLQDLFIKGAQWIFFAQQYDPNNAGRYIDSNHFQKDILKLAERVCKLSEGGTRAQMEQVVRRIGGENTLTGNRMFWRFDYMVNRRPGYYASSRMTSTRTVGNEAGNGDGEFNYYAANGVNYVFVTGKEYAGDYFKKFNNRQYPGITAEQDNEPLPVPDWGAHGNNGNAFAGSDYGAVVLLFQYVICRQISLVYQPADIQLIGCEFGLRLTQGEAHERWHLYGFGQFGIYREQYTPVFLYHASLFRVLPVYGSWVHAAYVDRIGYLEPHVMRLGNLKGLSHCHIYK